MVPASWLHYCIGSHRTRCVHGNARRFDQYCDRQESRTIIGKQETAALSITMFADEVLCHLLCSPASFKRKLSPGPHCLVEMSRPSPESCDSHGTQERCEFCGRKCTVVNDKWARWRVARFDKHLPCCKAGSKLTGGIFEPPHELGVLANTRPTTNRY